MPVLTPVGNLPGPKFRVGRGLTSTVWLLGTPLERLHERSLFSPGIAAEGLEEVDYAMALFKGERPFSRKSPGETCAVASSGEEANRSS